MKEGIIGKTKEPKVGVFYIGKKCAVRMKLKKVLAIFHITYFQGWSVVCSCYISLGISVKNIRHTHK